MSAEETHPLVAYALAQERQAVASLELAEQVAALNAAVQPATLTYARVLAAEAAAWSAWAAVATALRDMCAAFAGLLRGLWGGPVAVLGLVVIAALALGSMGWTAEEVVHLTSSTVRAVRCSPDLAPPAE